MGGQGDEPPGRPLRVNREGSQGRGRPELWHRARVEWSALAREQPAPAAWKRARYAQAKGHC